MTIQIKNLIFSLCLFLLIGCGQKSSQNKISATTTAIQKVDSTIEKILGERINGPANIRDKVNGDVIFSLDDKTLITCTEQNNGWFSVGLQVEIPNNEFTIDTFRKGRKIVFDGKEVGVVLKDMQVSTSTTTKNTWAELTGYTYKDNIYSYSIIENALADFLLKDKSRTIKSMQPFIDNFGMEKDEEFKPFITFFTYENWIDDPSPLLRIQFIFSSGTLIGIVHSRQLTYPIQQTAVLTEDLK